MIAALLIIAAVAGVGLWFSRTASWTTLWAVIMLTAALMIPAVGVINLPGQGY